MHKFQKWAAEKHQGLLLPMAARRTAKTEHGLSGLTLLLMAGLIGLLALAAVTLASAQTGALHERLSNAVAGHKRAAL